MAAILQASLQVLRRVGLERLTTTRVAERAGVSVGTLYQYFPNKRALLAAVLREHLNAVTDAVATAARSATGRPQRDVVAAVVRAFVEAKFKDAAHSRALYAVALEVGGPAIVRASAEHARHAVMAALERAPDGRWSDDPDDRALVGWMLVTMMVGPVQEALVAGGAAPPPDVLARELAAAMVGYLERRTRPRA